MDWHQLVEGVQRGERGSIARALTLVESNRPEHQQQARELLEHLPTGQPGGHRVGITGPPGVGKSSLIETLGLLAIQQGRRVGVLAIDPSSQRSGGSILGDKTRMEQLSRSPQAFVRPSPAAGALGGVARRTREAMLLLEAAGYDLILVETVGVGQSEVAVAELVDSVLLLALPGAGDDLQGMKRGLMETADLVFVNKADGERLALARTTANQLSLALRLLPARTPGWQVPVLTGSALQPESLGPLYESLTKHRAFLGSDLTGLRAQQSVYWLERGLEQRLMDEFLNCHREAWKQTRADVAAGRSTPEQALQRFFGDRA